MSKSSDGAEFRHEITADPSKFEAGMRRAADAAVGATGSIKSSFDSVGKVFEAVSSKFAILAGVVAGGAFFKEAISEANKLTGETMALSKRLGLASDEASALNTALGDIGSDSETYIGAFEKFAKQVKTNEDGLQAMGLKTRDTNGQLRDSNTLFREALAAVGEYRPGLDQTTAAMTLFGKGVEDVLKLQRLNNDLLDDARAKNEELGLTVTQEGVATSKAYKAAMNDVGDVLLAVKNTIGQAVMPAFTAMGQYLASTGPYVVAVFRGAVTGLMGAFRALQAVVTTVFGVIFEVIDSARDQFGMLSQMLAKAFSGDFGGAAAVWEQMGARVALGVRNVMANARNAFNDGAQDFASDLQRIWGKGTAVQAKGGGRAMGDFGKTNGGPKKEESSRMGQWEAELAEAKLAIQERATAEGSFRQMSLEDEAAYWRRMLALTQAGTKENIAVRRKLTETQLSINKETFAAQVAALRTEQAAWKNNTDARLEVLAREAELVRQRYGEDSKEYQEVQKRIVETRRQAAEQIKAVDQELLVAQRNRQLAEVQAAEDNAKLQEQLGIITREQLLAQEASFEARRYEIQAQALQDKLALQLADPDRDPAALQQLQTQIEQLELQHQERMRGIRGQSVMEGAREINGTLGQIQSGWANLVMQIAQGSTTLAGAVRGVFSVVAQAFVQMGAQMVAQWAMQKLKMMIFGKTEAMSEISNAAAKAGANGVASMAGAPFPLNTTAPFFGGAMAAAASAFAATASAAGGFDIPAFMNPVTQLHAREMVLPAKYADVIRNVADGDGQAAGAGRSEPAIQLRSYGSVGDWMMVHRTDLGKALDRFNKDRLRR